MGAAANRETPPAPRVAARQRQEAALVKLWDKFDTTWGDLNQALEGISLRAVGRAFDDLAIVLRQLSTAVAGSARSPSEPNTAERAAVDQTRSARGRPQ